MSNNEDPVKVYLVNPPLSDPWRKRKDYDEEQREARERHEMFVAQHKVILRSHRATIAACVFSGIAALATCAIVYLTYQQQNSQQDTSVKQQTTTTKEFSHQVSQ